MYAVSTGKNSVSFELYFPSASIDHSLDHTRSLVHIHKCNNVTPNYLLMDLVLKNKLGVAYAQDLVIHVIVYGISGYHNNVLLCVCVCGMKIMK
ncbi:hypothetical protein pdam_00014079 [Pocillopora damicornis]|uniref:Uncharacterized protein n=1 Tax=Pocillopora damicornis TaxID=46731 RepID=A0A3M6UNF9_POCDA|nr:hypothetical protein pdam_00014079 [Pocillopora damicornis]